MQPDGPANEPIILEPLFPPRPATGLWELDILATYGTRYVVVHLTGCACNRDNPERRMTDRVKAMGLPEVLRRAFAAPSKALVWDDDFQDQVEGWMARTALAHCASDFPATPSLRHLLRPADLPVRTVAVFKDAMGKHMVHGLGCGHAPAIAAREKGTAQTEQATSLADLATTLLGSVVASGRMPLADVMASEFTVKPCVKVLPTWDPEPVPYAQQLAAAQEAIGTAIKNAADARHGWDVTKTDAITERLNRRTESRDAVQRRQLVVSPDLVRQHVGAAAEAGLWALVIDLADRRAGMSAAEVGAALAASLRARVARVREDLEIHDGDSSEAMVRGFEAAERSGHTRFIRHASTVLHDLDAIEHPTR